MQVLITYDINFKHSEVKTELIERGFMDDWMDEAKIHYLPNTTLWHENLVDTDSAKEIFIAVIDMINRTANRGDDPVEILRFMAVEIRGVSALPGKPHT